MAICVESGLRPRYVDGQTVEDDLEIIGVGAEGYVLLVSPDAVLKIPRMDFNPNDSYRDDDSIATFEHEKAVYKQLGDIPGVARCLDTSPRGITLEYYDGGDLYTYIYLQPEVCLNQKRRWILQLLDAVGGCHRARVFNIDIQPQNLVIANDSTLRMIDFTQAIIFPEGTDMEQVVDDLNYSMRIELFNLGCLIYSIMSWTNYYNDWNYVLQPWPDRASLPSTVGLPYGTLIEACWYGLYRNTEGIIQDLARPRSRRKRKRKIQTANKLRSKASPIVSGRSMEPDDKTSIALISVPTVPVTLWNSSHGQLGCTSLQPSGASMTS